MNQARHPYRLILAALALFLAAPAGGEVGPAPTPAVRWPLDLPAHWLTSNFMEYRGGRFHAGLDFKTREQEGFPARAVEDGWVERVRVSPAGYGKVAYLRGASGRTYVYAHLGRFNDRLAARVRAAQEQSGAWRIDLEFAAGELPLRAGEVVGLTGQTGTTGPHLHFEVRDADGAPVDPQAAGFAVRDTIAPVIVHVRALPAGTAARVNGTNDAWRLDAPAGGAVPVLSVSGPVAFSARVVEATDPAGHRLEPWRLELSLDGQVVFRRTNERFTFEQNARQRLEWLECGPVREQWLHTDPADPVTGREGALWFHGPEGHGLAPGRHHCRLEAIDRAGNRASAAWDLEVGGPAGGDGGPRVTSADWKRDSVEMRVACNSNENIILKPFLDVIPEGSGCLAAARLGPADDPAFLIPVVLLAAGADLDTSQVAAAARQGLQRLAPGGVRWEAAGWPVDGAPRVEVPEAALGDPAAGPLDPAVRMYRWDGSRWQPAGRLLTPSVAGGPRRLALEARGLHAALRDTMPPVLGPAPAVARPHPGFGPGCEGVTPPRWEILAVPLRDTGSGIDVARLRATWDGEPLLVEPDPLRDRVLVELPSDAAPGDHLLVLTAADEVGMAAQGRWTIRCTPDDR